MLIISCSENPFIREINLENDDQNQQITVHAQFNALDSVLEAFISRTIPISSNKYEIIKDADISVFQGGNEFKLIYNDNTSLYEGKNDLNLTDIVALEIDQSENDLIVASQSYPRKYDNIVIDGIQQIIHNDSIETSGTLAVEFHDDKETGDFYILEMEGLGIDSAKPQLGEVVRKFAIFSDHPTVEYSSLHKIYFNDSNFNGNEIRLEFSYSSFFLADLRKVEIRIRSITREGYYFELSSEKILESNSNPLAEPIILFNNIENGIGVFSLEHSFVEIIEK